jgi:hypothetical protein
MPQQGSELIPLRGGEYSRLLFEAKSDRRVSKCQDGPRRPLGVLPTALGAQPTLA